MRFVRVRQNSRHLCFHSAPCPTQPTSHSLLTDTDIIESVSLSLRPSCAEHTSNDRTDQFRTTTAVIPNDGPSQPAVLRQWQSLQVQAVFRFDQHDGMVITQTIHLDDSLERIHCFIRLPRRPTTTNRLTQAVIGPQT